MGLPNWGTVAGVIATNIDKFIPSKSGALYDQFQVLLRRYEKALKEGRNSMATKTLMQIRKLAEKAGFTDGEM